jgi:hypothetical protein
VIWGRTAVVTNRAELRERQPVKVALFKGEPVPRQDFGTVHKVITDLRWSLLIAIVLLFCAFSQPLLITHEHGEFRWVAATSGLVMALCAPVILWQRRRTLNNAGKLLGPGSTSN